MCGICLIINNGPLFQPPWCEKRCNNTSATATRDQGYPAFCCLHATPLDLTHIRQQISRRGPDAFSELLLEDLGKSGSGSNLSLHAMGAVLRLRGEKVTKQPFFKPPTTPPSRSAKETGSFLLWNGEGYAGQPLSAMKAADCDTAVLHGLLVRAEEEAARLDLLLIAVRDILEDIVGEFAFVFFSARFNAVVFGRDPLGRRSLVFHSSCVAAPSSSSSPSSPSRQLVISTVCGCQQGHTSLHSHLLSEASAAPTSKPSKRELVDREEQPKQEAEEEQEAEDEECWSEVPIASGVFCIPLTQDKTGDASNNSFPVMPHVPWKQRHTLHPLANRRRIPGVEDDSAFLHKCTCVADFTNIASSSPASSSASVSRFPNVLELATQRYAKEMQQQSQTVDINTPLDHARPYLEALSNAVCRRVCASSRCEPASAHVTVLFSGGIDSTVLAALTHFHTHPATEIELVNVAFGDFPHQTPDRIACHSSFLELRQIAPQRKWRLVLVDVPHDQVLRHRQHVMNLIYPLTSVMDLNIATAIWFAARGVGTQEFTTEGGSLLGGGALEQNQQGGEKGEGEGEVVVDKTLRINDPTAAPTRATSDDDNKEDKEANEEGEQEDSTAQFQPLLDALISEGFDSNGVDGGRILFSTLGKDYSSSLGSAQVQARGYKKLGAYLDAACRCGLVKIETINRSKYVRLARDEDIAKAQKVTRSKRAAIATMASATTAATATSAASPCSSSPSSCVCTGRVIILGMGADETLGGYVRHQRAFSRSGADALTNELQRDFERLWQRNLGRDDRSVCDHGKEGRFPFIDEEVLATLSRIPREHVCDMRLPAGQGDKKLLRTCARMLGLGKVCFLQKRAIQFGTRVANRKVQGNCRLAAMSDEQLVNPRAQLRARDDDEEQQEEGKKQ